MFVNMSNLDLKNRKKDCAKAVMYNNSQNIQVAVRCRPLNEREKKQNSYSVIECNEKKKEITSFDRNSAVSSNKTYSFDKVFGVTSKQIEIYNQLVRPVVLEVIEGYNCTIFAYGQTGTGKTHTMEGDWSTGQDMSGSWENDPNVGVIPRSVAHLFTILNSISNCEYSVKISFIELYNEELSDLLSDSTEETKPLRIFDDSARKGSVLIPNLSEVVVKNKSEVYSILQKGVNRRQTATTLMNSQSSRSHSIFTVTVFIKEKSIEGEETIKVGKLNLVDLAGSENIERSGATGKRAAEAGKINKSLTTLGRVITALVEHRDHIPYRESNLTRLLQDSLGGKTKTTIIATISPALCNLEETLSTLDYAHKAKSIRNKPEINQKMVKQALIKEYTEEIDKLKRELYSTREKNGVYLPADLYQDMESKLENQKDELRELLIKINALQEETDKLNELFVDTKQTLDEKTVELTKTTVRLASTEQRLDMVQIEWTETKFLLDEQVKTEQQLYQEAVMLQQITIESHEDCQRLHEKIGHVTEVHTQNKTLTEMFVDRMRERFASFVQSDQEFVSKHTGTLCQVCESLNELIERVNETKEENMCQLNIFEDGQQNWLSIQTAFLNDQIKHGFCQFYNQFCDKTSQYADMNKKDLSAYLNLCQEHARAFQQVLEGLKFHTETIEANSCQLETRLKENSQKLLDLNKADTEENSKQLVEAIDKLACSIQTASTELNELTTFKREFESEISRSIESIQCQVQAMSSNISRGFGMFESKLSQVANKTEHNVLDLNELKLMVEASVSNQTSSGEERMNNLIMTPINELLELNLKSLTELSISSKAVATSYQNSTDHFQNTLKSLNTKRNEQLSTLDSITSSHSQQVEQNCQTLTNHFKAYGNKSNNFFSNFIGNSVEAELNSLLESMQTALKEIEETNASIESQSNQTQEFSEATVGQVVSFGKEEFAHVVSTGNTPKNKTYYRPIELTRTQAHSVLVENFRKKSTDNEMMLPPPKPDSAKVSPAGSIDNLMRCASESSFPVLEAKQEAGYPLKRSMTDKENCLVDKASKQSKSSNQADKVSTGASKPQNSKANKKPIFSERN